MAKPNKDFSRIEKDKIVIRSLAVGFETLDKNNRSIMARLASENPVRCYDWETGQVVNEVLLADGFVFSEQIPLLDSHNRNSVKDQLGSIREIKAEKGELVGRVFFGNTPDADAAFALVEGRHLTDLSIGYNCEQVVNLAEGQTYKHSDGRTFNGPLKLSLRTVVKECSVTPIGADEFAKFRSASAVAEPPKAEPDYKRMYEIEHEENANLKSVIKVLTINP